MVESLGLGEIRTDGDTQVRVSFSSELVSEYAEAMKRGDEFPPVDVYFDGDDYWLADGFYRVAAAREARKDTIDANVHQGGRREALLHAVGANETHGLRRTNEDKRKAVHILLADEEWQGWSDREIARQTRTSQPFVTKLRHDYLQTLSDGPAGAVGRRVRRGERTYTMDTGRIGTTQTPRPRKAAPAERTKGVEGEDAKAQLAPTRPTLTVVPPHAGAPAVASEHETITSVTPPLAVPLAEVYAPAVESAAPVYTPPAPSLVEVWEQAGRTERQEFVETYRPALIELLDIQLSQSEIILKALRAAMTPITQDALGAVQGVDRRRLGRNLTRLVSGGQVERQEDGCYAVVPRPSVSP